MKTSEKLTALRAEMAKRHMDAYVVVTDDFHASEYVGAHFKAREYLSGFTGSAGTLVVLPDSAALWTDGRYFLQAAQQLEGSGITLMRMGEPGVPEIADFLRGHVPESGFIGFDSRTISNAFARAIGAKTHEKHIRFAGDEDLVDLVWADRPALSCEPVWELDVKYAGLTRAEKLRAVREKMAELGADVFVIPALDEIAWLLNLRGGDVLYTPVFLSYLLLERGKAGRKLVAGFRVHIDPHGSASCHARQLLDLRAAGYIGVAPVALVITQISGVQMHPARAIERDGHVAVCIGLIAGVKTRRGSVARGGSRSAAVLRGNIKLCAGERAVLARIVLQGRIRTGNVQRQRFAFGGGQRAGDGIGSGSFFNGLDHDHQPAVRSVVQRLLQGQFPHSHRNGSGGFIALPKELRCGTIIAIIFGADAAESYIGNIIVWVSSNANLFIKGMKKRFIRRALIHIFRTTEGLFNCNSNLIRQVLTGAGLRYC